MKKNIHTLILILAGILIPAMTSAEVPYREKYADVLRHYSQREADSLKYKAALFLIDNMHGHQSPDGPGMEAFVRHICTHDYKKFKGIHELMNTWNQIHKTRVTRLVPDSSAVTCSYLIDNIDDAFEAWDRAAWRDEISFDQFCRYILPYRSNDEHVGREWRKILQRQYGPLIAGVTDMRRAFAIIQDSVFKAVVLSNDYCPYSLDPVTCNTIGRAECGQQCILLVAVMRSLGIPSAIDFTPMWADYSRKSHGWVAMIAADGGTYTVYEQDTVAKRFNPIDASNFTSRYKPRLEDNCPYIIKTEKTAVKVYRTCFEQCSEAEPSLQGVLASPFADDVSLSYGLSSDIEVNARDTDVAYLCAFLSGADWMPVARTKAVEGKVVFHGVGKGSVCAVATIRDGRRVFLSCPFLVGEKGMEKTFAPSATEHQTICVNRKYPLCSYTTDTWGFMRGGAFEASMTSDFSDADTLALITTMPFGMTSLEVEPVKRYRYLRYHAPNGNRSSLAELQFYTSDETGELQLLTGTSFADGVEMSMVDNVFDGDPSTICRGLRTGYTIGLDLGMGREASIVNIQFNPSTDLNFVEKGHLYELYYFDTDWHLIGRQVSKGTHLTFSQVPCSALLLLKDKTKGQEERIFEYIDNRQVWY